MGKSKFVSSSSKCNYFSNPSHITLDSLLLLKLWFGSLLKQTQLLGENFIVRFSEMTQETLQRRFKKMNLEQQLLTTLIS